MTLPPDAFSRPTRRAPCLRTAMSSGSRFAFRPFRQSAQEGGAPSAPHPQPSASRPAPKLSFFRQPGPPRPKTSAEHVEVKEEPLSIEDDGDVFQWSSSGGQSMMPPPSTVGQRSRFHVPGGRASYSPAPPTTTDNVHASFGHQRSAAPRMHLMLCFYAHILMSESRHRSG